MSKSKPGHVMKLGKRWKKDCLRACATWHGMDGCSVAACCSCSIAVSKTRPEVKSISRTRKTQGCGGKNVARALWMEQVFCRCCQTCISQTCVFNTHCKLQQTCDCDIRLYKCVEYSWPCIQFIGQLRLRAAVCSSSSSSSSSSTSTGSRITAHPDPQISIRVFACVRCQWLQASRRAVHPSVS